MTNYEQLLKEQIKDPLVAKAYHDARAEERIPQGRIERKLLCCR